MAIDFPIFGFQLDLARQIERPEVVLSAIRGSGRWGYNACMLYLEDAYAFGRHPAIGRRHAYSVEFMKQVHALCRQQNQELIPVFPSLGHAGYITGKSGYEPYDEGAGTGKLTGCLSPSHEPTYSLLRELYEDWCSHIPGRYLHVGLDESDAMGQRHLREHGPGSLDAAGMFADHVNRLAGIARSLGRRMVMWGDMFYYLPAAIERVDKDVIVADWYYYPFDDTPGVELFGFERIDSSRLLRRAGLEVWGIPSIWPNCPAPNIHERWANLRDWMRYGQAAGVSGIINTEWENSWGLPGTTQLVFELVGRMARGDLPRDVDQALAAVLAELSAHPAAAGLAGDIAHLGRYHITAYRNRKSISAPVQGMISTYPPRRQEYRRNARELAGMLKDLPGAIEQARDQRGRDILRSIQLCHRFLQLFWETHDTLSEAFCRLAGGLSGDGTSDLAATLSDLAGRLERFSEDYVSYRHTVRYDDDPKALADWTTRTATQLRQWAQLPTPQPQAALSPPGPSHPLLAARLQSVLHCRHPALPLVYITMRWPDGHAQQALDIMIPFEGGFANPLRSWTQSSVQVLDRPGPPETVEFAVRHYGQIGIGPVKLWWQGKFMDYVLARTEGPNVQVEGGVCWLGPRQAVVGDPLTRGDEDRACYELAPP